jgi:uncharacterized membrane protein
MSSRQAPIIVFALLCLALAGVLAIYLPMLPDRVATHFDGGGSANGWSSRADVIASAAALVAITAVIFLVAGLLMRVPDSMINIPNKSYWLAPGRRDRALAFMRDWLRWFVALTLALLVLTIGMGLQANLAAPVRLAGSWWWVLAGYGLIAVAMVGALVRRFRAPTH